MSAIVAVAGSIVAQLASSRVPAPSWERTNFSGHTTSLTGGIDVLTGLIAGSALAGRQGAAAIVASLTAGVGGYVDDHLEDRFPATGKGFKGHLGALKEGRLSSGIVKIAATGAGSILAAGALQSSRRRGPAEVVVDAALISLTANLMNLLDLRPGRARKAALALAAIPAVAGSGIARVNIGAASGGMAADLSGQTMLGDLGANALGAHLGVVFATYPMKVKAGIFVALVALNAASEKVSFSQVIERTTVLRQLDMLGRPR